MYGLVEMCVQRNFFVRMGVTSVALMALSGCGAHRAQDTGSMRTGPQPFAHEKRAKLCRMTPLKVDATGHMSIGMVVDSEDNGICPFSVNNGDGGGFVSFGVVPYPEHGKAALYNYEGRIYIEYVPEKYYEGHDFFSVELIPIQGQVRRKLAVKVHVRPAKLAAPMPVEEFTDEEDLSVAKKPVVTGAAAKLATAVPTRVKETALHAGQVRTAQSVVANKGPHKLVKHHHKRRRHLSKTALTRLKAAEEAKKHAAKAAAQ